MLWTQSALPLPRAAGYRLVVCDRSQEAVARLQKAGAKAAESPAALASYPGLSAIVSMLPSSEHVRAAYLGSDGVLSVEPGQLHPHLLIDCSTIGAGPASGYGPGSCGVLCIAAPAAAAAHEARALRRPACRPDHVTGGGSRCGGHMAAPARRGGA